MTLVKSSNRLFPSFFDEFLSDDWWPSAISNKPTSPAVNIKEHDKGYTLEVAAPGMKRDDFKVTMDEDMLTIEAEQKKESEEKEETYTRKEFSYTHFKRSFQMPEGVVMDKIKANYKDGILAIDLPVDKKTQKQLTKQIQIN